MFGGGVVALVAQLASADPATCDRAGLAELVSQSQQVRGWLDAVDVCIAVHASRLAEQGSCEAASTLLAGGGRRSARDAEAAARRGAVCADMPAVHDALAAGAVSAGHVDAVARLSAQLDDAGRAELKDLEPTLVESATAMGVETFERELRELARLLSRDDGVSRLAQQKQQRKVRRWVDRVTGMCHTHIELDPETDAQVSAALDAAVAAARARQQDADVNFDHLKADALVDLITGARATDPRAPEVSVLIDYETLCHGLHADSVCETGDGNPLPPETVRRLCCDAQIVPIVLGGDGVPLDLGREQRLASREQRRALRAMYRTCAHPGCTVRFNDCRIHHAHWWDHHGPTDLANLLPLCEAHHHLVHEGHWTLTMTPDRTITLRRPDGTLYFEGNTTTQATAPAADEPRPHEHEIPIHLRRAAEANRAAAARATQPAAPADPPSPSAPTPAEPEAQPGESEIPLYLRRATAANRAATFGRAQPDATADRSPAAAAAAPPPTPADTTAPTPAQQRRGPPPRAPAA